MLICEGSISQKKGGGLFFFFFGFVFSSSSLTLPAFLSLIPLCFWQFLPFSLLSLFSFLFFFFFPYLPCSLYFPPLLSPGSGGWRENQRGSAPRGAKDVAFQSEHLQPPGVHPRRSPVPVEHQTLYHMSGNHGDDWQVIRSKQRLYTKVLICYPFCAAKS